MKTSCFSHHRFWSYFRYDATQMWRNHVKASIGIGLSGLFVYLVCIFFNLLLGEGWDGPNVASRLVVFMTAFTILELYQTRTYGYLTDRRKGSAWLMIPASTFEKWLSMILMTLVVIPGVFMLVFFSVDTVLSLVDPTVGRSLIASIGAGLSDVLEEFLRVNVEYDTNWSIWPFVPPLLVSFWCNYLFFLLCGLVFRKHKILGGFLVLFGITVILSLIASFFPATPDVDYEDLAQASLALKATMWRYTAIFFAVAACLAGGIYWRLKTLKH